MEHAVSDVSQRLHVAKLSSDWNRDGPIYEQSRWLVQEPWITEKMLRDDVIAHAIFYRARLASGPNWSLAPKDESHPLMDVALDVGTKLLEHIGNFTDARLNLSLAYFLGACLARVHGAMKVLDIGDGRPRVWWVPERIEDMPKTNYRIRTSREDGKIRARWERWDLEQRKFLPETAKDALHTIRHVYQDDQSTYGYGRALREVLGYIWWLKTHLTQEGMQAIERIAGGILVAKIDGVRDGPSSVPNEKLVRTWVAVLEKMRSRHVLVIDSRDSIEMVNPSMEGYQLIQSTKAELRESVLTLVLSANLPTGATKGGSYALSDTQADSTSNTVRYDRDSLEEALTRGLMRCVWTRNQVNMRELGIEDQMPRMVLAQDDQHDPKVVAEVAETLNRMGVPLDLDEVYERTGFSRPGPGARLLEGALPQLPLFDAGGVDTGVVSTVPDTPDAQEVQDTALNGAQVTAAAEIIDRVVRKAMPPGTAIRMLTSMFNLPPEEAKAMVDEAAAFVAAPPPPQEPALP